MLDRSYFFWVGTYSALDVLAHQPWAPNPGVGIYRMRIDPSGELTIENSYPSENPAVLIPHGDGKHLYAILETIQDEGTIARYESDNSGELTLVDQFKANGRSTCYIALSPSKDTAIVINYWDAIIDVCSVDADGKLGEVHQSFKQYYRDPADWRQVKNREDHWGNRQVGPHAHCAHFWHDWVFIPDLGENAIFQYRFDKDAKTLTRETWIEFEAGSGPRHMAMHPTLDICYVSNELFNTVCVARLDATEPGETKPRLIPQQYVSTLENREQESYVSEIKLSPDARFLYVSNRGDNSIACFQVADDGALTFISLTPTGGKFPRHFAITPCGKALIAANQDSGTLRVFERDIKTGLLNDTGTDAAIPAPCYIRFTPS